MICATYTLNRTAYFVRPLSSMDGGRISMVLSSRSRLARFHKLMEQICTVSITHDGRANDFWHLECCRCLIELVVIVKNVLEILNAIDENRVRCNARKD
jgi:hypothetical protein